MQASKIEVHLLLYSQQSTHRYMSQALDVQIKRFTIQSFTSQPFTYQQFTSQPFTFFPLHKNRYLHIISLT